MMKNATDSQKQFRDLELELRQIQDPRQSRLAGSFSAFQAWLEQDHPQIIQRAKIIALDVRLWRDTQDVLRQLWEHVYCL